jgi:hypothetical protein
MVVCAFVFFLLTIVLSVLLRFMDSDYPLVSPNSSSKSNRTIIERGKMETLAQTYITGLFTGLA